MVRIRVKILTHDGVSKRDNLWYCLAKTDSFIFKIIENKDAFILVTEIKQVDKLLTPESKALFQQKGLEIKTPPEHKVSRTLIVRGVDKYIHEKNEEDIKKPS